MADVSVRIYSSLLPTVMAGSARQRPRLAREFKTALASYWQSFDTTP
ncbi:MAG: hypothetical protein U5K29_15960 [Acidimicrobiales bacterium]|nr:hypothetical protein [Acidimicrobiales bacterium]